MTPLLFFLNNFDFKNPDFSKAPPGFPDCDLSGFSSSEVGRYNAVRGIYEIFYKKTEKKKVIPSHGGYQKLKSYQSAEIVFDFTNHFCDKYIDYKSRTRDQMVQAARSGKQNIAEGSKNSGTSKMIELRLTEAARGSLEELLKDYEDFLRVKSLPIWTKDDPRALAVRKLAYLPDKSYKTYEPYLSQSESAANAMICLINQANYLLDRLMETLEQDLIKRGDFKDRFKKLR